MIYLHHSVPVPPPPGGHIATPTSHYFELVFVCFPLNPWCPALGSEDFRCKQWVPKPLLLPPRHHPTPLQDCSQGSPNPSSTIWLFFFATSSSNPPGLLSIFHNSGTSLNQKGNVASFLQPPLSTELPWYYSQLLFYLRASHFPKGAQLQWILFRRKI